MEPASRINLTILLLGLLAAPAFAADLDVSSASLGRIPRDRTPDFRLITNADLSKAASIDRWVEGDTHKWYVSMDSLVWEFYSDLDPASVQFAPGSDHLSLLAQFDNAWYLVTDNKFIRNLGTQACQNLALSRDGKHDACVQITPAGCRVLLDGKPITPESTTGLFDQITAPALTHDGHLAFTARSGGQAYIIRDNKILAKAPADQILPAIFSPDDKHLSAGLLLRDGTATHITHFTDGTLDQHYNTPLAGTQVSNLTQSADGQHLAWSEDDQNGLRVIIDGATHEPRVKSISQIALSSDGKRAAWLGHGGVDRFMLCIDKQSPEIPGDIKATESWEIYDESKAALRFINDGTTLQCTGEKNRYDFSLINDDWKPRIVAATADAKLTILAGTSIYANDQKISSEKFLDAAVSDSATAIILTESPTPLNINDKTLSELTRTRIHLQPPPADK